MAVPQNKAKLSPRNGWFGYRRSSIAPALNQPLFRAPHDNAVAAQIAFGNGLASSYPDPDVMVDSLRIKGEGVIDGRVVAHSFIHKRPPARDRPLPVLSQ